MFESFVTAFFIYFVVIDPIGKPLFLAVTQEQDHARKLRTALEGTATATATVMFFALCGA
jgi:small neutral amino acid transporter SnatA (MarC family)